MNKYDYKIITPFRCFMLENFPFIEDDFDALTNWQLFCKIGKEINKIINSQNEVGNQMENTVNAFIDLQNFVNNYFDNLDVQDEINNKLDDMAEDGTLETIVARYITSIITRTYENVNTMKADTSLENGMFTKTLGYYNKNDNGGATYYISNSSLTPDNASIIELDNNLYAVLIIKGYITPEMCGAYGDNIHDDANALKVMAEIGNNIIFGSKKTYVVKILNVIIQVLLI